MTDRRLCSASRVKSPRTRTARSCREPLKQMMSSSAGSSTSARATDSPTRRQSRVASPAKLADGGPAADSRRSYTYCSTYREHITHLKCQGGHYLAHRLVAGLCGNEQNWLGKGVRAANTRLDETATSNTSRSAPIGQSQIQSPGSMALTESSRVTTLRNNSTNSSDAGPQWLFSRRSLDSRPNTAS